MAHIGRAALIPECGGYLCRVARNFSTSITFDGKTLPAIIIPNLRRNGMHYEVNIPGYPRFWMRWGAMDRYELVRPAGLSIPQGIELAVSDAIEREGQAR